MATAPTGTDLTLNYTSQAFVQRFMPKGQTSTTWGYLTSQTTGQGASNTPGLISVDDLVEIILTKSREADGELDRVFYTPFPDITATGPKIPIKVRELVTAKVCEEIWTILEMGNRIAPTVEWMHRKSDALLAMLLADPDSVGIVQVRTPEQFQYSACGAGSPYKETGLMTGVWYRLANRNVIPDSVRLVRSDGKEAFRSDGLPFGPMMDYGTISSAEGTMGFYNSQILSQIAAVLSTGGGVIYDWSWVRQDFGLTGSAYPTGVRK